MRMLYIENGTGLDQREHILLREVGSGGMPVVDCGWASGPSARQNQRRAELMAKAPVMLDMLEQLGRLAESEAPDPTELGVLAERARVLCACLKA